MTSTEHSHQPGRVIDVRGPRFSAAITATVMALALIFQQVWLVALQTVVFAIAAFGGLRLSPYGNLFRFLKRRLHLGPPPAVEPEGPPRFAQLLGFVVALGALIAFALDAPLVGWVLTGVLVALPALQALTGLCVGCELYLAGQRLRTRGAGRPAS